MQARSLYALPIALLLVASTAFGQPADCTGISGVHSTDPDLFGELDAIRVASGLAQPLFVTAAPGDNERLFILEQAGRIKILKTNEMGCNGTVQAQLFLDIQSLVTTAGTNERGLLGMAFHPDYQNNGYFYVYYTAASPSGALTVTRFQRQTPDVADPGSATLVISVPHPIANHNAGHIGFSPIDGRLYVGTGDGGSGCDPGPSPGNAQNINSLLGKMLRLNVDSLTQPYGTEGNPYDDTAGLDEIWDIGLRNPYRWSFDRETGAQYIGDVGQNAWEELDCAPGTSTGGNNYGWVNYEGAHGCPNPSCGTQNPCPPNNYLGPVLEYPIGGQGRSIIGGNVYRGCRMPDLHGTYFYSDFYNDFIRTFRTDGSCGSLSSPVNRWPDLNPGGGINVNDIAGYGEDNRGEIYIVDRTGEVFKVVPDYVITEVSGQGAAQPLIANANGEFEWEEWEASSCLDTRLYKIYRADTYTPDVGPEGFQCEHLELSPTVTWAEPEDPADGQVFYYLVTAQNSELLDGGICCEETVSGAQSDGTPRVVDTTSSCFD